MIRGCRRIYKPQGTSKAEVIKELINKKLKEEHEKKVPSLVKKLELKKYDEWIKETEKELKNLTDKKAKIMSHHKIGTTYNYDKNNKGVTSYCADSYACYIPKEVDEKIQQIIILRKLLKNKQSKEIEEELIKEYELEEYAKKL